MFDLDYLTISMNYEPVLVENQANKSAGDKIEKTTDFKTYQKPISQVEKIFLEELEKLKRQEKEANDAARKETTYENQNAHTNSTNLLNIVSALLSAAGPSRALNDRELSYPNDPLMPHLVDIYARTSEWIFIDSSYDDEGVITDFNNLETNVNISPTPTIRIHTIHPKTQVLGDPMSAVQIRRKMNKNSEAHALMKVGLMLCKRNSCSSKFRRVYVTQPPGFVDPKFPNKVYKVVKALYGLHQAPKAWYATLSTFLEKSRYRRGAIDKTFYIKQDKKDIMLVQFYVDDIIFGSTKKSWCDEFEELIKNSVKTASTPIETQKPLVKDEEAVDVDVHIYRSMIGSLMYLTASRPGIMFAVCACSRFYVTPKASHLQAVKRIFRYLKGQPKLGLWYPKVLSFDLKSYSDSDYLGANLDKKYTTRGCQFLGRRLISLQCKKQTIVATSTTEAEYVADAHCCGQNPVFHSKTKHIEIHSHFIKDAYEKKLIQVLKIHTDDNVADLLTEDFDVSSKGSASPKQTALGKDISNLFMACSFPKTICYKLMLVGLMKDAAVNLMLLDDADGVECLPNEEIFTELARMGHEKPPPKLTFYKAFFSAQWKFLIHTLVQCVSAKRTAWNEFSCSMASAVICLAIAKEEDEVAVPTAPTLPSPTTAPLPPPQEPIPTPPQAQPAPPSPPLQEQPNDTFESSMTLLNALMETCATLRVKKLEKKRRSKSSGLKRLRKGRIDDVSATATKDVSATEPTMFDDEEGRIYDVSAAATKEVNATEPTMFDDKEVTMTMAQTIIKMKAEKTRLLDEKFSKRLHDEEVEQAAAMEKQEKDYLEKAKRLQQQYDEKHENIDWNVVAEQIQEKHLDNIRKYQSLKRIPVSIAPARKNMIIYLKNMAGYKMEPIRGMTYD
nr:hypothetical protein [Tanacetum cinerariifolium]